MCVCVCVCVCLEHPSQVPHNCVPTSPCTESYDCPSLRASESLQRVSSRPNYLNNFYYICLHSLSTRTFTRVVFPELARGGELGSTPPCAGTHERATSTHVRACLGRSRQVTLGRMRVGCSIPVSGVIHLGVPLPFCGRFIFGSYKRGAQVTRGTSDLPLTAHLVS